MFVSQGKIDIGVSRGMYRPTGRERRLVPSLTPRMDVFADMENGDYVDGYIYIYIYIYI